MPILLTRKGMDFQCYFEPEKKAKLQADCFVRLNYEGFFFCGPKERAEFLAHPLDYSGLLTDPVSKLRFRPSLDSPKSEHEGIVFYFENNRYREIFEVCPEDYFLPSYKMKPDEEGEQHESNEETA